MDGDARHTEEHIPLATTSSSCPMPETEMLEEFDSTSSTSTDSKVRSKYSSWAEWFLSGDGPISPKRQKTGRVDTVELRYYFHRETPAVPVIQPSKMKDVIKAAPQHARRSSRLNAQNLGSLLTFISDDKNLPQDPLLDAFPPKTMDYVAMVERDKTTDERAQKRAKKMNEEESKNWIPHPSLKRRHEDGTATTALYHYFEKLKHAQRLPIAGIIQDEDTDSTLQEDGFHARPSIKLMMPDHLKAILVDDWENVTKNQQLVPLPSPHPVNSILADYLAYEKPKRQPGSAEADLLEEVIAGLKQYFDKSLGRILLYRFERSQYLEVIQGWEDKDSPLYGKTIGDTYGPEHLCRLLVSLPELIAQTNMDQPSVNRLREELTKLTNWLGKHAIEYFASEYETPNQSYIEKARA